jgi:hypothetical protein
VPWRVVCWIRFSSWPQRGGGFTPPITHLAMDGDLGLRSPGEIVRIWSRDAVLEDGERGPGDSGGYRVASFLMVWRVLCGAEGSWRKKSIFWKSVDFATDEGDT